MRNRSIPLLAGTALLASTTLAQADVLTFDGVICGEGLIPTVCSDGSPIHQSYGDIAGQLNVNYRVVAGGPIPDPSLSFRATGWSDLINLATGSGGHFSEVFLDPAPGFTVRLNSFDLGFFGPGVDHPVSVMIEDGGGNSLSNVNTLVNSTNHSSFLFNLTDADGIRIFWGANSLLVGIDNIDFTVSQLDVINPGGPGGGPGGGGGGAVPEPASLAVLGTGLLGLTWARRRRV